MKKKEDKNPFLRRMTDEEYRKLLEEYDTLPREFLGRMREEEYKELWNGNPPKEERI